MIRSPPFARGVIDFFRRFDEAPLSKSYLVAMIVIGTLLWIDMAGKDINLPIAGVFSLAAAYAASRAILLLVRQFILWLVYALLRLLVWCEVIPESHIHVPKQLVDTFNKVFDKWLNVILFFFWISFFSGFFYSSVISGDWPSAGKGIPSACFGYVHQHHWQWGSLLSALIFIALATRSVAWLKRYGNICFAVGLFLFLLVGIFFGVHGWFTSKSGFWLVFGILGIYSLATGVLFRSKEVISRWYRLFLVASLGIALGVAFQGLFIGVFRNFPGALITWDKEGCTARQPSAFISDPKQ
ncbi:MAG: hypothetical protein A3J67_03740 [Parcubacteria group bacterium RIFCSPHIGHO2_02_FULL_48_10b]|nr:MAG: hypothetical protein A3J67_03740 [Parcubacteria group bacterium RIFCSPHIGHO2_02_FULL_48_10b]